MGIETTSDVPAETLFDAWKAEGQKAERWRPGMELTVKEPIRRCLYSRHRTRPRRGVTIDFDENVPSAVARAIRELASALDAGSADSVEVLHAFDLVHRSADDVPLIQAVADGTHAKAALVTTDKKHANA
jgi:hypothetical protein